MKNIIWRERGRWRAVDGTRGVSRTRKKGRGAGVLRDNAV